MSKYDADPDEVGENFAEQQIRLIRLREDIREVAIPHVDNLTRGVVYSQAGIINPRRTFTEALRHTKKTLVRPKEGTIRHNVVVESTDKIPFKLKKADLHFQEKNVDDRIWGIDLHVEFNKKIQLKTAKLSWVAEREGLLKTLDPTIGKFIETHCESGGYLYGQATHASIEFEFGELPAVVVRHYKPRTIYDEPAQDYNSHFIFDPKTNQFERKAFSTESEKNHYNWAYGDAAVNPIGLDEYFGLLDATLGLFPRVE